MAFRWSILFIAASLSLTFQPVKAQQLEWPIKQGVFRLKGISMERLQRDRAIWVYLPPNYRSDEKQTFDLLLMQDGQNLFADSSSFVGEWRVDEQLDSLYALGIPVPIVVAPENGGAARIDEYSPWAGQYGGGEGDLYATFLAKELLPMLQQVYSIDHTWLMGSSLGALINTYCFLKYPHLFCGFAAYSPAYWYNPSIHQMADSSALAGEKLLLHLAAAKEDNGSVVQEMVRLEGALRASDTNAQGAFVHWIHEKGAHNERYWSSHFSETWLLLQQFNPDQPKKQRFQTFECHSPKGKWWGAYSGLWPETYTICKD